jgi:CubicO group peptidase (beta-lactamase class C family)
MASFRNSDPRLPIMQGSPPALIVPKMDWDRPPWNRWAFQHVREILPTAEVWRGRDPAKSLPRREVEFGELEVPLQTLLDETFTEGFLVIHDGAIVCERYFNGMDERTLHLSQSMAKSVTAAVAGILAGRGEMDIAAPITDYLPELGDTAWRGALLQHVLDMTTGVRFSEEYTDPYSDIGRSDVASGWKPIPPDSDPDFKWPRHMFELIMSITERDRPHGELFQYRSIETDVLAFAMERVTAKRLPQLVSEELWQKMGAEESACFTLDPAGYALADGGFNATLRDYARFGLLYVNGSQGIVPPDWIAATRNGNHGIFGEPYTLTLPEGAYRNQFWIKDPRSRSLLCRGVFGQLIYISWDYKMVAVKLSSWPDFLNTDYSNRTLDMLHRIGRHLNR